MDIIRSEDYKDLPENIITSFKKLPFVCRLTNLKKLLILVFCTMENNVFNDFHLFVEVDFPHLEALKWDCICPPNYLMIKFLERNGRNLKEFWHENPQNS